MTCWSVRRRLSAYIESDLTAAEAQRIGGHLRGCPSCSGHHVSLLRTGELIGEMPRLEPRESVAARVLERIEPARGAGLAVFRTFWAARPLIVPSLVPATLVLLTVLSGALLLDAGRPNFDLDLASVAVDARSADSGTEVNPLFPSAEVGLPQALGTRVLGVAMGSEGGEGTFFIETVIARDGTVSAVTVLDGDSLQARPIVDALRRERFEPVRLHGRRVAVSVYRLISRLEVRAPLT